MFGGLQAQALHDTGVAGMLWSQWSTEAVCSGETAVLGDVNAVVDISA